MRRLRGTGDTRGQIRPPRRVVLSPGSLHHRVPVHIILFMCPLSVRADLSAEPPETAEPARERPWSMLSNHGLVFVVIARDPHARVRDIADRVGITERAAHRIVADLCTEGFISRTRVGRRTVYEIHPDQHFRHPALRSQVIGPLLQIARAGDASQDAQLTR